MNINKLESKKKSNLISKIDSIDTIVGERIFTRRRLLGLSQQDIADAIGVSVQQIQKYEKSVNRVSSGKLYRLAKILKLSTIDYFFPKITDNNESSVGTAFAEEADVFEYDIKNEKIKEKEVLYLIKEYSKIKDNNIRKSFLDLVKFIASLNYAQNT